jgi:putative peptide zinc metalloprotease protein
LSKCPLAVFAKGGYNTYLRGFKQAVSERPVTAVSTTSSIAHWHKRSFSHAYINNIDAKTLSLAELRSHLPLFVVPHMTATNPLFRQDIVEHAFEESHGARSVVLEDPVANKYYRISPYELELLKVLDGSVSLKEAVEKLKLRGRYFTLGHAAKLVDQVSKAGLLLGTSYGTSRFQTEMKRRMDAAVAQRSLLRLYYLYVPLINPDRFLERTLWVWRLLVNRFTALLFVLAVPGAAYLLVAGLAKIEHEFLFFFNLENLLYLWIAIALVKLTHEFSHAYTAKSLGLRVPEMGVAFLIFFPCLYCNTTAAWELADRRQRMSIALAGVASELVVAVVSVYIWYFSHPGVLNSVAFFLAAISLISSLFFNGNPLLKFDGYFVLTDLLRMPNLQPRALNKIRYLFLNRVLGIESVAPVKASFKERVILVTYGISAVVYRVFLYTAIVSRVYEKFDKSVGVLLGGAAFMLMVVRPLARGVMGLVKRRTEMQYRPGGLLVFAALVVAAVYLLAYPWSSKSSYHCVLQSAMLRQIVIPAESPVAQVCVRQGDRVAPDRVVLVMDRTKIEHDLKMKEAERVFTKKEISIIQSSDKDLSRLQIKYIDLSQTEDAIKRIQEDIRNLEWKAPFAGTVAKLAPTLQPGAQPGKGAVVGELASEGSCEILGLMPEVDVAWVQPGNVVDVWFPIDGGKTFSVRIREISPFKTEDLEGSPFSSRMGGEIATEAKEASAKDAPLEPYYLCKADLQNTYGLPLGITGRLVVHQPPRSTIRRIVDAVYQTFHREVIF